MTPQTVHTAPTAVALEDAYPLAALQAGMLFHSTYESGDATYHDLATLKLRGRFDRTALAGALAEITARHPVLRTSVDLTGFSEPIQLVHREATIPLEITDLSHLTGPVAEERLHGWRQAETRRPFDWSAPPLLRTQVHLMPGGRFALSLSFHHAILDGWSVATLTTELFRRYAARLDGTPLPVQPPTAAFRDFVAGERAVVADEDAAAFWRQNVTDPPSTRIPRMPGYPVAGASGIEVLATGIDKDLALRLEEVARRLRTPLRTVLLSVHLRVLGLLTGEPEVMTGLVTHGRPESDAGAEVLGLFLNTVPLRAHLDVPSWAELVRRTYAAETALLPHRRYPLFEIQRASGRTPLLDTLFDYRDFHVYRGMPDRGIEIVGHEFFEQTDLAFAPSFIRSPADGGLALSITYHDKQFPRPQMEQARHHYLRALADLADDPGGDPRPTAPFLAAHDTPAITLWNATAQSFTGGRVPELVAAQVTRTPDGAAVGRLTYGEFGAGVYRLARHLAGLGLGTDQVAGVCLDRGTELVTAVHAVLAAGGAYLPLEPDHPAERLGYMIEDARAGIVVTTSALADRLPTAHGVRVVLLDQEATAIAAQEPTAPPIDPHPDALAYVIYTSGSTGRPKGVGVSHRALANRLRWMQETFPLTPADRVLHKTPFGFDVSVWELCWPLTVGSGLTAAAPDDHRDPQRLADLIADRAVTTLHFVPSMLDAFLDEPGLAPRMAGVRRVICSGEALTPALAERFHAQLPHIELHNLYGPTEAAIDVTWHLCRPGEGRTPIGKPIANTRIEILDPRLNRLPIGTPGELFIGGVQLARGYLHHPAMTADRFLPDPYGPSGSRLYRTGDRARWLPDGEVEYLGRTDHQVKIRGMRVEPGEIEAALLGQPEIHAATIVTADDQLIAYLVPAPGAQPRTDWRTRLRRNLPDHMIPTHWITLDALPLTSNGKLDRSALPPPAGATTIDYLPPRDPLEARLAVLWEEILGVAAVGVHDDFFDLGGHSLLALRLAMRIRQELGHELPTATVLAAPTVARLADLLRDPGTSAPGGRLVPLNPAGDRPPIFLIHALGGQVFRYLPLARRLGRDQPVYALAAKGLAAGEEPHDTLDGMVEDYIAHIRAERPHGPYVLGGYCIGGNIALEVGRRLRDLGEQVPLTVLFYSDAAQPVITSSLADDTMLTMHALADGPLDVDFAELSRLEPDERLLAVINAAAEADRLPPDTADLEQARRFLRVFRANAHAVGFHRHDPYPGDVALFAPAEDGTPDALGWPGVVTGRFTITPIRGDRVRILYEPQVADAAAQVRSWMDDGLPED